jgi:predicted nuclease of predicted toxin-antitoxin system
VKLLFDENLSRKLVARLSEFYPGSAPKVIWLRRWTHPAQDAELVLRRDAIRITEFATDSTLGFLVLDRQ